MRIVAIAGLFIENIGSAAGLVACLVSEHEIYPKIAVSSSNVPLALSESALGEDLAGVAEEKGEVAVGEG